MQLHATTQRRLMYHSVSLSTASRLPSLRPGYFANVERARYANPRSAAAENVVVKTFKPGFVLPEDLQPLIGEVAQLAMLRHRCGAAMRCT